MTLSSLHILGSPGLGGAERFFIRLVNALAERHENTAVVVRPKSPVPRFLHPSVSVHYVAMRNGWDLFSALKLRALIGRSTYAVVQTYMGRATRLTRVPRACSAVHIARLGGYYKIPGYYTHAHAWIGNTKGICDYLVRQGLPAHRVFHIPNFVPSPAPIPAEDLAQRRRLWNIPDEARIVFSLGRFVAKKGFDDLLAAFSVLCQTPSALETVLIIAGDGPEKKALQKHSDALGLGSRVRWVGWQDDPAPLFQMSDVFVCPSRHEPLGNVILEAWSHGAPVVSTRTVGAEELITENENGLLTPIADPAALAQCIHRVLQDPGLQKDLGENGRKTVQDLYSEDRVVAQYEELYERLVQ